MNEMALEQHRPRHPADESACAPGQDGAGLRARLGWFTAQGWPVFALTGSKRQYAGCRACSRGGHGFAACLLATSG